jgi:hypothetical protein
MPSRLTVKMSATDDRSSACASVGKSARQQIALFGHNPDDRADG